MMKQCFAGLAIVALASPALAQTRTVAATGADHTTINAALAFFSPDPDVNTPNVIQITDSGVYDEAITIQVPVTLEGTNTGNNRPIIAAQLGPVQVDSADGLCIVLAAPGTVTLRNLIIVPSATNGFTDDLLRAAPTDSTINLENVVLTAAGAASVPVTYDGLTDNRASIVTHIGDDPAFLSGTNMVYNFTNVVFSHALNAGTGRDGIVCSGLTNTYNVNDGCVFSFCGRLGVQATGASFVINAPTTRVKVIGNEGFAGIWYSGAQSVARTIDGCDILNNIAGAGIENQNRGASGGPATSFTNMIIAGNGLQGLVIGEAGETDGTYSNITIANNTGNALQYNGPSGTFTALGTQTFTDCVIAGKAGAGEIAHNGVGTLSINNSAVVTSGPFALAGTSGSGTLLQSAVINVDPVFAETVNFNSAAFYDVQAVAYGGAASGSGDLSGGADYAPSAADVAPWSLYTY